MHIDSRPETDMKAYPQGTPCVSVAVHTLFSAIAYKDFSLHYEASKLETEK